ncbi:HD domain-containing protein [Candidatus Saccharibacteria bacterium]|nr:HD domain-containing protein [Candidatus Saccharibacteria bacterium]
MSTTWETTRQLEVDDYTTRLYELCAEAGFDNVLMPVAAEAISHYSNDLPYHNIEHMFYVAETALALCELYDVDDYQKQVIIMSALWHDADYRPGLDDEDISKEHRSGTIAYTAIMHRTVLLHSEGMIDDEQLQHYTNYADDVRQTIISTLADREPQNIMEQVLNEADLSNVSGNSLYVLQNTALLFVEKHLLAGEDVVGSVEPFIRSHLDQFTQYCSDSQDFLTILLQTKFKDVTRFASNIAQITPANIIKRVFGVQQDE